MAFTPSAKSDDETFLSFVDDSLAAVAVGLRPGTHCANRRRFEVPCGRAGNHLPDYSFCGYAASEQPIPSVPTR